MLIMLTVPSASEEATGAACAGAWEITGAGVRAGAGLFTSGWVCCIFTVAFGRAGFAPPSAGRVMRAVSFFGAAGFGAPTGAAGTAPAAGAAGLSGTWGFGAPTGGFGGTGAPGTAGRAAVEGGGGTAGAPGGFGGGGTEGAEGALGGAAGAGGTRPLSFVVSFFGAGPGGGNGLPGRLIRTVSRLTACCSCLGGSVMRIVSAFEASSVSDGAGGISSAIEGRME